jgi:SAM-dependent methyltransferase
MFVPARRFDPEWMDRTDNNPDELNGALDDIHAVNRFLGGSKTIVDAVRPYLLGRGDGEPLSVLDIGTGGADLPLDLVSEARRSGRRIRIVAVDRDPVILDYARRKTIATPEIEVQAADAFHLPFAPGSFDLVTASMFLHHFTHADAVRLLSTSSVTSSPGPSSHSSPASPGAIRCSSTMRRCRSFVVSPRPSSWQPRTRPVRPARRSPTGCPTGCS